MKPGSDKLTFKYDANVRVVEMKNSAQKIIPSLSLISQVRLNHINGIQNAN